MFALSVSHFLYILLALCAYLVFWWPFRFSEKLLIELIKESSECALWFCRTSSCILITMPASAHCCCTKGARVRVDISGRNPNGLAMRLRNVKRLTKWLFFFLIMLMPFLHTIHQATRFCIHWLLISRLRERYKVCVIINFCNSTENNRTERRTNEKCQRKNDVGDHTDFDNYKWLCRGHTRLGHTLLAPLCLRHCLSFIYS